MHVVELLAFFLPALGCAMSTTWLFHIMRLEVNEKLPDDQKVSALFGYPGLLSHVESLHRRYYPQSGLRKAINILIVIGVVCMIGVVHAIGGFAAQQ